MDISELTISLEKELQADIGNRRALDTIAYNHGWITFDGYPMTTQVELFIGRTKTYADFCKKHNKNIVIGKQTRNLYTVWTDERKAEVQKLYNDGMTCKQIGDVYDRSESTITDLLNRMRRDGWNIREPKRAIPDNTKWKDVDLSVIYQDRKAGMTFSALELKYNIPRSSIRKLLTNYER